jgi:adenylate kinase
VATTFSKLVYEDLLEGCTIKESFNDAMVKLRVKFKGECESCCCGHSHAPECEWHAYRLQKGNAEAHALHSPTCDCSLTSKRKHRINCRWFKDFENFYINEEAQENCKKSGAHCDPVCCCRPNLIHDETMKLDLIFLNDDETNGDTVIYPPDIVAAYPDGSINYGESKFYGNLNFYSINLIGQNKLIFEILNKLKERYQVIYLFGPPRSGKTTICKFLMNYLQERGLFRDLQIINKKKIVPMNDNWTFFEDMLIRDSRNERHLYVLEDFDEIIRHKWDVFHRKIVEFLDRKNFFFIVTLAESSLMFDKLLTNKEAYMAVMDLGRVDAAKLLLQHAGDKLSENDHNVYKLAQRDLFNRNLMANEVLEAAFMLKNKKNIHDVSKSFYETKADAPFQTTGHQDWLAELESDFKECLQLLNEGEEKSKLFNFVSFLATFPAGVVLDDLIAVLENDEGYMWGLPSRVLPALICIAELSAGDLASRDLEDFDRNLTSDQVVNYLIELNVLSKKMWLNVKQERIGREDKVVVLVNGALKALIEGSAVNLDIELPVFIALINNLTFHKILLKTLIESTHNYEELIEGSKLNQSPIWREPNYEIKQLAHLNFGRADSISGDILKSIFAHYETNYASLMSDTDQMSLVGGLRFVFQSKYENFRQRYLDLVEDVIVKILTANKLLNEGVDTQEYLLEVQNLYKSAEAQQILGRLQFKVEYSRADKLYSHLKLSTANSTPENRSRLTEIVRNLEYLAINTSSESADYDMT